MEVLIKDLNNLKLSPSLIVFLKCIHVKDNVYLEELNKVADVFTMAKHLESLHFIKIVGSKLDCESFEIRKIGLITYLDKEDSKKVLESDVDEVLLYLNKKAGKAFRISTEANRKVVKGRLSEGYSINDLRHVVDVMVEEWINTSMDIYLRPETLFNSTKFQGYVNRKKVVKPEINKMI